ncbi:aminotransferase class I/II-fold pyridoxal phosphate-dependent enzyme [Melioribacter sp. OK-6-Me]|uniref:aminotransferase class I/II-fold pyridoxal phosphate-dependent enzyme n=1 Tax=unclassified Melioribacter TaxID=2627329 RepID=UPI003EDB04FC
MISKDPLLLFELKPIKAAKVSEISESTAASSVPAHERVNFHIGNPVQDERLYSLFMRLAMGIDLLDENFSIDNPQAFCHELGLSTQDVPKVELIAELIKRAAPYSPRGGYIKSKPEFIIEYFNDWLSHKQQEPLSYDTGAKSGKREIILASNGISETLRIFFHSVSEFMVNLPADILLFDCEIPEHLKNFEGIRFHNLGNAEEVLLPQLNNMLNKSNVPKFLILGKVTNEVTRRHLRNLSLEYPLFFVEVNNAPNHLSLAREAKMMNRVLRFITPSAFSNKLKGFSLVFIAGNHEFIKVLENVHFQLKGTPSSTEITLLNYLLKSGIKEEKEPLDINVEAEIEGESVKLGLEPLSRFSRTAEKIIGNIVESKGRDIENKINRIIEEFSSHADKQKRFSSKISYDRFSSYNAVELYDEMIDNFNNDDWKNDLKASYLSAFINHHPEYKLEDTLVVSGSSRTALSILGFHCGIREAIIPDLSWTYEHCFPEVFTVPLKDDFQIDIKAIIDAVQNKLSKDAGWKKYGAVVLNNPHNATGQIFDRNDLKELLKWLLEREIKVVDDLSYQNVKPSLGLEKIDTLRQLCSELVEEGYLTSEKEKYVITIHSMSKTDSFAGARLSVVEIRLPELREKFQSVVDTFRDNISAIYISYLLYRNKVEDVRAYHKLRNRIFYDRSKALEEAAESLPAERNRFNIKIKPPVGSMYPQMIIDNLPTGLSLDWLASGLARQGIGLIPLSTFARTEKGFETGRKSFRLTLGGSDGADVLGRKTRRVLIDLNRMIAEESANYNKHQLKVKKLNLQKKIILVDYSNYWKVLEKHILENIEHLFTGYFNKVNGGADYSFNKKKFLGEFIPYKLSVYQNKFEELQSYINEYAGYILSGNQKKLELILEREFYKDSLERRKQAFRTRMFDRTVHPTQMYSIKTDIIAERIIENLLRGIQPSKNELEKLKEELVKEYLGLNVAIVSSEEPQELILDLKTIISAENFISLYSDYQFETFLSFWGDWDGSNRPSGQGHSLVAFVLIENIVRQARILEMLIGNNHSLELDEYLIKELEKLPQRNDRFTALLNQITQLTHQLEKRYRGTLPFNLQPSKLRKLGMKLHIAQDPVTRLWHHNDRLERKMLDLRIRRRNTLEYYFDLNKRLRKTLHGHIPEIMKNLSDKRLLLEILMYRDLLRRFVVTPRIHQKLITAQDQFAIDTTVHNINEINEIAARYGNPGMVLALQVSMTTRPETLISLDRKMRSKREEILRENSNLDLPAVWLVPLFEDLDSVSNIKNYLDKIWEYSFQSRRINQDTAERFNEIITEIFVAGSDLSQQVGQAMGMNLYREAKYELMTWLAANNLIGRVRMKMGSGEPMQRQGGYYSEVAGKELFIDSYLTQSRFNEYLAESTRKSTQYAITPLLGVFAGGDLRTFQSNISEKLRYISTFQRAQLLYHVKEAQEFNEKEIQRAGEPLSETRLQFKTRGLQELERLTVGKKDEIFNEFLNLHRENFRQILYGRDEDVVGIHLISYFIGRTTPPLRDRPTVRPGQGVGEGAGQKILEKIAGTIPFSKYGSLLRAISHNQSQSVILGINQLTTGLFRALNNFSQREFTEGEPIYLITERVLPKLPVYEMLQTLRIYHDVDLKYLSKMEKAFPAGNSALIALREDIDSMHNYLSYFQKELLRRHGLEVSEFFEGNYFIPDLLPTLRPDVAVLLQKNLFNTSLEEIMKDIKGNVDDKWLKEVQYLLKIPEEIKMWRQKIWDLLEEPVYQRVASFVELAIALYSLSSSSSYKEYLFSPKKIRAVPQFTKSSFDDNMQQFLSAAVEYLAAISQEMVEVPINIIRALKEVERIIKIEEQALSPKDQDKLKFYLLQIARLAGENG